MANAYVGPAEQRLFSCLLEVAFVSPFPPPGEPPFQDFGARPGQKIHLEYFPPPLPQGPPPQCPRQSRVSSGACETSAC